MFGRVDYLLDIPRIDWSVQKRPLILFTSLWQIYGETGQFDEEVVRRLAKPEIFPKPVVLLFKLLLETKPVIFLKRYIIA